MEINVFPEKSKANIAYSEVIVSSDPVNNQPSLQIDIPARTMIEIEEQLWNNNIRHVCGVDEVGRGPLAGPVVAAAVILPVGMIINGVTDSKLLTPSKRIELYEIIKNNAVTIGLGAASPAMIDRIGILNATHRAFHRAIHHLSVEPDYLLVDGFAIPHPGRQTALIKGDRRSQSIAAASIIAKVTRDRLMETIDLRFPRYGFARHKGYGTALHRDALKKFGPCPLHRRTFKSVLPESIEK